MFIAAGRALAFLSGLVLFPVAAFSSETIRVAIADHRNSVTIQSRSGLDIGSVQTRPPEKKKTFTPSTFGKQPVRIKSRTEYLSVNGTAYRGLIELRKNPTGGLLVINELDIEEYLLGVIAAEIPAGWEFEALKAQAIASRTYALYKKRANARKPYHVLSTMQHQMYRGRPGENDATDRAVQETAGLVLKHHDEIIPAYYHASCGGQTENAAELWGTDAPYLKGVDCDCQEISAYGVWQKNFNFQAVRTALNNAGYGLRNISHFAIGRITPAGRVKEVTVRHEGGTAIIPAESFRAALGYERVPSVFFDLNLRRNELVLSGRGRGHGIGLCQWGAKIMAMRGADFRSILSHYYPGTRLARLAPEEREGTQVMH